ncbi:MAG TPA: hypothetical protein VMT20_10830 [Terriglobia bacterium]|nr:hypothetical protein [Terriglobia bacterium]
MPRYKVGTGQVASLASSLPVGQTQTFNAGLYDNNNNPILPDAGTAQWTSTDGGTIIKLVYTTTNPSQCSATGVAPGSTTLDYNASFSGQPYSAQFSINVS